MAGNSAARGSFPVLVKRAHDIYVPLWLFLRRCHLSFDSHQIWLLEEMENRPIAANSLLSLKSESETTEEDLLLTLPGYRPRKVAAKATTLDPKGSEVA